jgi:hypothetical protein
MEARMSSESVTAEPAPASTTDVNTHAGLDLWRVQLGTGEVRVMSLDALDDAFQSGLIDESTPVLPRGAVAWTKLADAAGLDAPAAAPPAAQAAQADHNVPSIAPLAVSLASEITGNATPYGQSPYSVPDLDIDAMHDEAFKALKPRKGRVFAFLGLAVVLAGGLGFAATKMGDIASSATSSLSAPNADKAAAAAPPPAAVDVPPASPAKTLTDEQKAKLAEADKAREAAAAARDAKRAKDRPSGPARRGPREKTSQPFVNGGNKFDPLNGAL